VEGRVELEEKKVAMEENQRLVEYEKILFFIDTSNLYDKQKEYINLMRDQVLAQQRMMTYGGIGGYGGMGGMGGMGAPMGEFMDSMGGIGGYGGMDGVGAMGDMGAPPARFMASMGASSGGFMASMGAPSGGFMGDPSIPSMPTMNDGFVPSPSHTTPAHTSEVAREDESNVGDAKGDGEGDEE
jgi:hypothetical protein